jgi:hypothetical protein
MAKTKLRRRHYESSLPQSSVSARFPVRLPDSFIYRCSALIWTPTRGFFAAFRERPAAARSVRTGHGQIPASYE